MTSIGIPVGVGIILLAILLTGLYVRRANRDYDPLIQALKTGKGQLVDVSLLRTGLYTLHTDLAIQLFFGRNASTRPRAEAYNPLTNFFKTKDDAWICIVARAGSADLPRMAASAD